MASNLDLMTNINDYEFIGFSFNGIHSSQYGLTVVSPSGLNQEPLFSAFEDKVVEVPGKDGAYYFGTTIKSREFTVLTAFDNVTAARKRSILSWLNPKTVGKLIFDDTPYKYYWVKVAAPPSFSYVPFERDITNGKEHLFKGSLEIQFLAVDPYGYGEYALVDQVPIWNGSAFVTSVYSSSNIPGWKEGSNLHMTPPTPALAQANVGSGYTVASIASGNITPNFFNGGNEAVAIEFTITIPVFNTGTQYSLTNLTPTPDEVFRIESLKYISALAATTGYWKIVCNPTKGTIFGYSSSLDNYVTGYNIGALHNGVFLKAYPGNNFLNTSAAISNNPVFKYKYKYW